MNEVDRKALQKWRDEIEVAFPSTVRTWQAACEHKQRDNDALKARVARLEGALKIQRIPGSNREAINQRLKESPEQSLAEVKAEALREAADYWVSTKGSHQPVDWLRMRANEILQEAEDERPNENTIGSEAARILKKYDDA